jgi:hypothetical protein
MASLGYRWLIPTSENLEAIYHLEDIRKDGRILLK